MAHGIGLVAACAILNFTPCSRFSSFGCSAVTASTSKDWVLVPLRDWLVLVVWLVAGFRTTVNWRGNVFVVGPGSVLQPERTTASVATAPL